DAFLGPALYARNKPDVSFDRKMREQPRILDDVTDPTPQPGNVHVRVRPPVDINFTGRRRDQTINEFQGCRLSRTAAAQQHQSLSLEDQEAETAEHLRLPDAERDISELYNRGRRRLWHIPPSIPEFIAQSQATHDSAY